MKYHYERNTIVNKAFKKTRFLWKNLFTNEIFYIIKIKKNVNPFLKTQCSK